MAGLKSIMISLDSFNEETNDKVRGKLNYKLALKGIKCALKSKLIVRVNSVITKINKDDIYDTIIFLYNIGVKNYSAFYFSPIGVGRERFDIWLNPEEYYEFWEKINAKIKINNINDMNIIIEKGYENWEKAKEIDISNFTGCGGGCHNTYTKR